MRPLGILIQSREVSSSGSFGVLDNAMVDITLNDLTKVKVIHFGTNQFLIYDFLYRLSIVTFFLGRTV